MRVNPAHDALVRICLVLHAVDLPHASCVKVTCVPVCAAIEASIDASISTMTSRSSRSCGCGLCSSRLHDMRLERIAQRAVATLRLPCKEHARNAVDALDHPIDPRPICCPHRPVDPKPHLPVIESTKNQIRPCEQARSAILHHILPHHTCAQPMTHPMVRRRKQIAGLVRQKHRACPKLRRGSLLMIPGPARWRNDNHQRLHLLRHIRTQRTGQGNFAPLRRNPHV